MIRSLKDRLCALLPEKWHLWLQAEEPRLHRENLWSLTPVSRNFGWERGLPIDRYYIEKFLASHTAVIRGRVLEVGWRDYTRKFGGDRVNCSDVLHYVPGNPEATIVADLTCADNIPGDTFDCIIFTQTLHVIFDFRAALGHLFRILKPGGVLLITTPGIAKISRREGVDPWGTYWHYTGQGAQRLFCEFFPIDLVTVATHGNVLATVAFLHGLATEELRPEELDYHDPDYELLLTVCAVKPGGAGVA